MSAFKVYMISTPGHVLCWKLLLSGPALALGCRRRLKAGVSVELALWRLEEGGRTEVAPPAAWRCAPGLAAVKKSAMERKESASSSLTRERPPRLLRPPLPRPRAGRPPRAP